MSSSKIPLGGSESQKLEFEAAEALARPEKIAREVVAMLNAEAGEVWIGLREDGGRAVSIDAIPDAERARDALHDSLIDTISPSPAEAEVLVEIVRGPSGEAVLRVETVPRPERRPYAVVRASGWHFVIRVGTRLRPLSREEIRRGFGSSGRAAVAEPVRDALERVESRLDASRQRAEATFVLIVEPIERKSLDLTELHGSDYLIDPSRLGVRRFEFSVTDAAWLGGQMLSPTGRGVRIGREDVFWLEISRVGGVQFSAPLVSLFRPGPAPVATENGLSPLAVLESPTSVFRLLAALYSDAALWEDGPPDRAGGVLATLAAFGIGGWTLRPRSPRDWSSFDLPRPTPFPDTDLVLPEPIALTVDDVVGSPDDSARRLWSRIYEAFGFWPEDHPREFDRSTGRLAV